MISASVERIVTRLPLVEVPLAAQNLLTSQRMITWTGIVYLGDDDGLDQDGDKRENGDNHDLAAAYFFVTGN